MWLRGGEGVGYHGGSEWLSRGPSTACTTGRKQATPRSGMRNGYFRYLRTWHLFSLRPWASSPFDSTGELYATPQIGRPTYSFNQVPIEALPPGLLSLLGKLFGKVLALLDDPFVVHHRSIAGQPS